MSEVVISVRDNGPLMVKGGAIVEDGEGNRWEVKETAFLCRCGQSAKKPFCDAAHKACGFESAPRVG